MAFGLGPFSHRRPKEGDSVGVQLVGRARLVGLEARRKLVGVLQDLLDIRAELDDLAGRVA